MLSLVLVGCESITTPGTVGGTVTSSAYITTFKVDTFTPGESIKLIWNINGTYDNVKLSKREIEGAYTTLLDTEEDPGAYEDTTLNPKNIYLYKLDVYSNGELQDTKRYFIFSSTDNSEGARVLYNVNLDDPDNHKYSVDMWIDTGSYSNVSLKTVANHNPETRTLKITTWSSTSYGGSVSGDPGQDSGVVLSGPGIYFIHYDAELPYILNHEGVCQPFCAN